MKNRMVSLLLAAFMLLFAAACAAAPAGEDPSAGESSSVPEISEPPVLDMNRFFEPSEALDIPDLPIAALGDYSVLRSDYAFFFYQLRGNMEYSAGINNASDAEKAVFWDSEIDSGTTMRKYLTDSALNAAKELAVIYAVAVERGVEPDEAADQQTDFDVLSLLSECDNNEQEFVNYYQMTSQQMREASHRMNLLLKFREEFLEGIIVAEEDIQAVFSEAPEYYNAVTVGHVFISCTTAMTPEEQAGAKATADEVFELLQEGVAIGELAYQYSEDASSQYYDGEMTFSSGEMPLEIEDWAFSAKAGDKNLIKTDYGYHIMELITPGGYESAKGEIEYDIRIGMFNQSLEKEFELINSPDWILDEEIINSFTV